MLKALQLRKQINNKNSALEAEWVMLRTEASFRPIGISRPSCSVTVTDSSAAAKIGTCMLTFALLLLPSVLVQVISQSPGPTAVIVP